MKLKDTNPAITEGLRMKDMSLDEWHILFFIRSDVGTSIEVVRRKMDLNEIDFQYALSSLLKKNLIQRVTMILHDRYEAIEHTETGSIRMREILEEMALRAL